MIYVTTSLHGKSKQDILSFNPELKNRLIIKWFICMTCTVSRHRSNSHVL